MCTLLACMVYLGGWWKCHDSSIGPLQVTNPFEACPHFCPSQFWLKHLVFVLFFGFRLFLLQILAVSPRSNRCCCCRHNSSRRALLLAHPFNALCPCYLCYLTLKCTNTLRKKRKKDQKEKNVASAEHFSAMVSCFGFVWLFPIAAGALQNSCTLLSHCLKQ